MYGYQDENACQQGVSIANNHPTEDPKTMFQKWLKLDFTQEGNYNYVLGLIRQNAGCNPKILGNSDHPYAGCDPTATAQVKKDLVIYKKGLFERFEECRTAKRFMSNKEKHLEILK